MPGSLQGNQALPLKLVSNKSCFGHTEGAAGAAGLLLAAASISDSLAPPSMHLINLNPYVSAAFDGWRAQKLLHSAVPRQKQGKATKHLKPTKMRKTGADNGPLRIMCTVQGHICSVIAILSPGKSSAHNLRRYCDLV